MIDVRSTRSGMRLRSFANSSVKLAFVSRRFIAFKIAT